MLNHIQVTPIAAESFGVRSMCTLVQTPDVTVLLDAGVSLAPTRFGLPPHPLEFQTIAALRVRLAEAADKAQVVTISHYHFDHHTPSYEDWLVNWTQDGETARQIYHDKRVIMKHPRENINPSQRQRAWMFQRTGGKYATSLEAADSKTFQFSGTTLRFSAAFPHGPENAMLGWVVMAVVECRGERFMHAPDVQGPISVRAADYIQLQRPNLLMVGGPPTYLGGFKVDERELQRGMTNLQSIVEAVPEVILEHHALRDGEWREKTRAIHESAAKAGHTVTTAAEYAGKEPVFLESHRKELFAEYPPSKEFEKWMRLSGMEQSHVKPPI
jgi:uncharacterized protein